MAHGRRCGDFKNNEASLDRREETLVFCGYRIRPSDPYNHFIHVVELEIHDPSRRKINETLHPHPVSDYRPISSLDLDGTSSWGTKSTHEKRLDGGYGRTSIMTAFFDLIAVLMIIILMFYV